MIISKYSPEGCLSQNSGIGVYTEAEIEKALASGKILEGKAILCDEYQNLTIDLGCMKGVIQKKEAIYAVKGDVKNIAVITRVGKPVCFKVMEITENDRGEKVALLSRKSVQEEAYKNYVLKLRSGDIIGGKITHLEPFGAFVDIGCGIISLITIDNISISRISHSHDRFAVGDDIRCIVKSVDRDEGRITLSHKELLGTWQENADNFSIGQTAAGIVRSVEQYGIFVELTPNLAGLAEYKEGVRVGQTASVYIKNILPEKMKVKLVIVDHFDTISAKKPMNYYIRSGHMSYWRYSPLSCDKKIESFF
ncbi:MAG: S1 RNA-binding domain-containing protein [Bacillota bacterium]|nr:S1 RNA-binding domain-containing protein [Bacillota bacterium]